MNKTLDEILHEFRGKCWHVKEIDIPHMTFRCRKCGIELLGGYEHNPSYSTDSEDYWKLLQEVKTYPRWDDFVAYLGDYDQNDGWQSPRFMMDTIIDTRAGSEAIAKFFCAHFNE